MARLFLVIVYADASVIRGRMCWNHVVLFHRPARGVCETRWV